MRVLRKPLSAKLSTTLLLGIAGAGIAIFLSPLGQQYPAAMADSVLSDSLEYLVYGGVFFAVFWVALMPLFPRRCLSRRRWPAFGQIVRECCFSLTTQLIFLAVAIWTTGQTQWIAVHMYTDIDSHGWAYFALTVFLVFLMHDTAFYWSHRLMHHRLLFDRIHRVHHQSVDPTPFATSAFHPAEAVVEALAAMAPLAIYTTMDWHPAVPAIWGIGQILFNVIGHLGFEIYPRNWLRIPLLCWKTPALHHYMHHQRVGGNYGLYFRFWDRLCGTEFSDFEVRYQKLFETPHGPSGK